MRYDPAVSADRLQLENASSGREKLKDLTAMVRIRDEGRHLLFSGADSVGAKELVDVDMVWRRVHCRNVCRFQLFAVVGQVSADNSLVE